MDQPDNFDQTHHAWTTTQARNRASLHQWCDLATGMEAVRGQWKASILIALSENDRDIPALKKRLDMANRRVLVRALRELEQDGLIVRDDASSRYALAPDGHGLVRILRDIADWQTARRITHHQQQ